MRPPALTDDQFEELRGLLGRLAGLVFEPSRRDSVGYCVAERLRATGVPDVDAYLALLTDAEERQRLLDEVTIQETHFFRNPPQVRALRQHVLPGLIRAAADTRRLRIWSAGCSTGEEPYTIAMLLRELLPSGAAGWDVRVLGTDVSQRALAAARSARYGPRAVQMATPDDLARHFRPGPDGGVEVRPEVRDLVQLRHHNLVTEPVPFGPGELDLVLCRNVTIYFGKDTTRGLMSRLHTSLRDGGYLFLGHSETLWQVSEDFRLVPLGSGDSAAFVYRRLDGPPDRRAVLPDRRTGDDPLTTAERRTGPRRLPADAVPRPRALSPGARPDHVPTPPARAGRLSPPPRTVPDAPGVRLLGSSAAAVPQVRAALADGRYAEAADLAAQLAAADPLLAVSHYLRGLALVSLGDDAGALVALRKAVYADPAAGLAHFLLGSTLERCGDRAAARREYAAAAATLTARDAAAPELGGRSLADLVALCRRLAAPTPAEETR